jgi:MFS family permease
MRTIVGWSVPMGVIFGAVQVALVAFGASVGAPQSGAWLFALMSIGGMAGAFLYGTRGPKLHARAAALVIAFTIPVLVVPLALARSLALMAGLVILAGCAVTPLMSVTNHIVAGVAPLGSQAEAYTWPFTAMLAGNAVGAAVAGQLIKLGDWRTGMLVAIASGVCITAIAVVRRKTLPTVVMSLADHK